MGDGSGLEHFSPELWIIAPDGRYSPVSGAAALLPLASGSVLLMRVTGRTLVPRSKKLNPLWWVVNDWDPVPPDWYEPTKSSWMRAVLWWCRNPFHNFGRYVLGVGDQNYEMRITRRDGYRHVVNPDGGEEDRLIGWEVGRIKLSSGAVLPWLAWGSTSARFYFGWQPTGFAGLKLNGAAIVAAPLLPLLLLGMLLIRTRGMLR